MTEDERDDSAAEVSPTAISSTWKVRGELDETDAAGVLGYNTSGSGTTYGVEGTVDSPNSDAAGVRGVSTAANGSPSGVYGESRSGAASGAALSGHAKGGGYGLTAYSENGTGARISTNESGGRAVDAYTSASTGKGYGVYASTDTKDDRSAGVYGVTNAGTGVSYGVLGQTGSDESGAAGVRGWSSTDGKTHGVDGTTYSPSAGASGVTGTANPSTGQTYGVAGRTKSSNVDAAGVFAENSNAGPALRAEGYVDVSAVGASAHLSGPESVQDGNERQVPFDTATTDHFGVFDTSSNVGAFTVPASGDYHVSTKVRWDNRLAGQTPHKLHINVDGTHYATRNEEVQGAADTSALVNAHLSRTLHGLSAGDTITVSVFHDSSGSKDLGGATPNQTYVTIDKVG